MKRVKLYMNVRMKKETHKALKKMANENDITLLQQIENIVDHYSQKSEYISHA